jgi:alanine racemase
MRTKAVIHLKHLMDNIKSIRTRVGTDRFICVTVKADAYGHGAIKIAKASLKAGVYCLGVAAVTEGAELRKGGIEAPILLLSQPHHIEIPVLINAGLTPFVSDMEFASLLNEQAKKNKTKLPVHMKIDTGMGRLGCSADESLALARHITSCSWLKLSGTATHMAVSDSADRRDIDYTKKQLAQFKKAVNAIRAAGINPGIIHAANSGAIILHPDSWFDMVRPGILLYGYKTIEEYETPVDHLKKLGKFKSLNVKPVMELISTVTLIKKIKKGETISYGRTWIADNDTYIAILAIGYADGLPRLASNQWQVLINDEIYPLAGRICMDQCCVDLGPQPNVKRWDKAVIFGGQAASANELALLVNTIPYEITCNINKRVPRIYKS